MKPNPHDADLPAPLVKKRRHARHIAHWMLLIAVLTAIPGWLLLGTSFRSAINLTYDTPYRVIYAWGLLLVSSCTLVLGLWYLLLAQVRRIARMVGEDQPATANPAPHCPNCGWPHDPPDRFCRHCGKPLPQFPTRP